MRHLHINAQWRGLSDDEELVNRAIGDIGTNVDISRGNNAGERCSQHLEGFQSVQAIQVSLVCNYGSLVFGVGICGGVASFPIENLLNKKSLITLVSDLSQ